MTKNSQAAKPRLAFVTSLSKLRQKIGAGAVEKICTRIERDSNTLVDIGNQANPFASVAKNLAGLSGVVIVGGYDVAPAARLDCISRDIRRDLGSSAADDGDHFTVWSDDLYTDTTGDHMPSLPVSRVPDCRDGTFTLKAVSATGTPLHPARFGLRNVHRPFAEKIYAKLPGSAPMLVSEPVRHGQLVPGELARGRSYVMLHGSDKDCSRFWGELKTGGDVEAMNVRNVPRLCESVVLAGCCWGALTVTTKAVDHRATDPIRPLTPSNSLALSFLKAGARAFVGCTGSHYSPYDGVACFGSPMHSAFWQALDKGDPPASALFKAKRQYLRYLPHGRLSTFEVAIEFKILRQFTCLGLGW